MGDGLAAITQAWSPSSTYQQLLTVWWVTHSCVTHPCVTHPCVLPNLVGTHPCVLPTLVSCPPLCYPTLCYPGLCLPALCYPGHCVCTRCSLLSVYANCPPWRQLNLVTMRLFVLSTVFDFFAAKPPSYPLKTNVSSCFNKKYLTNTT